MQCFVVALPTELCFELHFMCIYICLVLYSSSSFYSCLGLSMAASSSSPITPPQREYDVFLSFSGLDSRKNIISHLQAAFKRNNFRTFKDDKNLDRGKDIAAGLFEAIENSSMSIVVFSKNYFASKWCLAELEMIMECSKKL